MCTFTHRNSEAIGSPIFHVKRLINYPLALSQKSLSRNVFSLLAT